LHYDHIDMHKQSPKIEEVSFLKVVMINRFQQNELSEIWVI
jgi:hypothetical protein